MAHSTDHPGCGHHPGPATRTCTSFLSERRTERRGAPPGQTYAILYSSPRLNPIDPDDSLPLFQDGPLAHTIVSVLDSSSSGLCLESCTPLTEGNRYYFSSFDYAGHQWKVHTLRVAWSKPGDKDGQYLLGVDNLKELDETRLGRFDADGVRMAPEDLTFLVRTDMLDCVPRQSLLSLVNKMSRREVPAGELLITQGSPGSSMYLIQKGSGSVKILRDGQEHQVAVLGPGDVAGEMAVLTGEPRIANVYAEEDITAWRLGLDDFDEIAARHSDVRSFLTELVTRRFEISAHTPDRTIGKYVIRRKIDHGGWGVVYFGEHMGLAMPAAIKMMKHDMAMDPLFLSTFRKEAEIIARLNHPNIVQIYDIEELYRTIFIVMEYLEGEPLNAMLGRVGQLHPDLAVRYLTQICTGLGYAHQQSVIHRDVKPNNIFIQTRPKDSIKILDFGLACPPGTEDVDLMGTMEYASPEQIDGEAVDQRSDIYSMGIMAYEMVTGRRPYPEDDPGALLDMHCEQEIPDPALEVPDLPPTLREFIIRACRINPADRFQTMEEASEHLAPMVRDMDHKGAGARHLTTLFLLHDAHQSKALTKLLDEFGAKARELGVTIRTTDIRDI